MIKYIKRAQGATTSQPRRADGGWDDDDDEITSGRLWNARTDVKMTAVTGGRKATTTRDVRSVTSGRRRQQWRRPWRQDDDVRSATARRRRWRPQDHHGGMAATTAGTRRRDSDDASKNVTIGQWPRLQQDRNDGWKASWGRRNSGRDFFSTRQNWLPARS